MTSARWLKVTGSTFCTVGVYYPKSFRRLNGVKDISTQLNNSVHGYRARAFAQWDTVVNGSGWEQSAESAYMYSLCMTEIYSLDGYKHLSEAKQSTRQPSISDPQA